MSFDKLKKDELVAVADAYGADSTGTVKEILASLESEGITWDYYQEQIAAADEAQAVANQDDGILSGGPVAESGDEVVLAYRGGGSYSVRDRRWTKEAPYALVPQSVADELEAENPGLFEVASVREVESYYS